MGFDLTYAESNGEIDMKTSSAVAEVFPELITKLYSAKLYADYRLSSRLTIKAAYSYEVYQSSDWMLDGVAVDGLSNVITTAMASPDYKVSVVGLWFLFRIPN